MTTQAKPGQAGPRTALDNVSNQEKEQTMTQDGHDFKEYACFLKNKAKPYRRQTLKQTAQDTSKNKEA